MRVCLQGSEEAVEAAKEAILAIKNGGPVGKNERD